MKTYITEINVNNKTYAWPRIKANSWTEAEDKCMFSYEVVWELVGEILIDK